MSLAACAWHVRRAGAIAALLMLCGCANIGYYMQSVHGQLDIWQRQRPIGEVLADPATPASLREKLAAVGTIREFASAELGLPNNESYRRYADLKRPYVVWNVFAAAEFSVKPVQWCFAFAGCVNYRGYFSDAEAQTYAAALKAKGNDVFVGGIPAYSTLGFFNDPILNTFVHYPVIELARLVFHELAHQVAYARDDTIFNESFAVAVEQEGMRRWLERNGTQRDRDLYQRVQNHRRDFVSLILRYRDRLAALYEEPVDAATMRQRKAALFVEMKQDYQKQKEAWGGFAGYDRFFAQEPNNALLVSVALYTGLVPAFQALLAEQGGDLGRFYVAVKALAREDKEQRAAVLARLMPPK
jgi:predicted aminopeptidase